MKNITTVNLDGSELKVDGLGGQNTAILNRSGGTVYASAFPNIVPEGDNVIGIAAGERDGLYDTHGTVYLLGTGKVELRGTDYAINFSKPSSSSSGGGGSESGGNKAFDTAAMIPCYMARETEE